MKAKHIKHILYVLTLFTVFLLPISGHALIHPDMEGGVTNPAEFAKPTTTVDDMFIADKSYVANGVMHPYGRFNSATVGKPKSGVLGAKLVLPRGVHILRVGIFTPTGELINGVELPNTINAQDDGVVFNLSLEWELNSFPESGVIFVVFDEIDRTGEISMVGQIAVMPH